MTYKRFYMRMLAVVAGMFLLVGTLRAADFTLKIVSVNSANVAQQGFKPTISSDGTFVAFASPATLLPADTDARDDVYVRDRSSNTTTLVSVSSAGVKGNGNSQNPVISADGRYVLFRSNSTNLVTGTVSGWDLYLRDRQANETSWIAPAGTTGVIMGNITPDGRYIVFATNANGIHALDTASGDYDVFRYDRETAETVLITVAVAGEMDNPEGNYPSISDNGRYIAFSSNSKALVTDDNNLKTDVFLRDVQTQTTTRVSVGLGGAESNDISDSPAMSPDGRYVVFRSVASNLVATATTGFQIYRRDLQTATTALVSLSSGNVPGNGASSEPSISADGRFVAFKSFANNLVAGDSNGTYDLFLRDLQEEETARINVDANGNLLSQGNYPMLSRDGYTIAYEYSYAAVVSNGFLPALEAPDAAPLVNYIPALPFRLYWSGLSWAIGYEVQIDDNQQFSSPTSYPVAASLLEINLTADDVQGGETYFWRVRGKIDAIRWGSWSEPQMFVIAVP